MTSDEVGLGHGRKPLTNRQQQILAGIRRLGELHGYPPTVREIAAEVGLASPSSVAHHIKVLQQRGLIRRDAERSRAVDARPAGNDDVPADTGNLVFVPLVGTIAAGQPVLAEESVEQVLPLPRELVGGGVLFGLRVRGDSMVEAAICDGDVVVVRQQPTADNGDMVAALIDGEATVKVYHRVSGRTQLLPRNSAYAPIVGDHAIVLGRVVAVLRRI
ncbi:transcriptional repressor LexA [Catellatospora sichuanensis]|uniref:transcriptional repressor LexA n=1 Tax=Catellatospora sichuanensis TaxID=1969805 RepID=UPI001FEBD7ED|nr:transcriptional repressor LexA [Catellatospora sichuanensis]